MLPLLELTDEFIYTKSKSILLPVGFITRITMPMFFNFVYRKLEKCFKPLTELSTTIQSKVGIQVHNNNKNQQPCKTVADNIHNKHNASTHGITCVQDFLKYFLENCLTYIHSVPIYNPFTPLGC